MCQHEALLFWCNLDLFGKSQETPSANSVWNSRWDDPFLARSCEAVSTGTWTLAFIVKEEKLQKIINNWLKTRGLFQLLQSHLNMQQRAASRPLSLKRIISLAVQTDYKYVKPQELNDCRTGFLHFFSNSIQVWSNCIFTLHVHANKKKKVKDFLQMCSTCAVATTVGAESSLRPLSKFDWFGANLCEKVVLKRKIFLNIYIKTVFHKNNLKIYCQIDQKLDQIRSDLFKEAKVAALLAHVVATCFYFETLLKPLNVNVRCMSPDFKLQRRYTSPDLLSALAGPSSGCQNVKPYLGRGNVSVLRCSGCHSMLSQLSLKKGCSFNFFVFLPVSHKKVALLLCK